MRSLDSAMDSDSDYPPPPQHPCLASKQRARNSTCGGGLAGVTTDIVLRGGIDCVGHCRQGAACSVEAIDPARYPAPCTLHSTFFSISSTHCSLHAFPCTMNVERFHASPCTRHTAPYTPFPVHTSCILHSFTLHAVLYKTSCTLHDAVCTLFHESCTLHSPRFLPALRTPHSTSPSLQPTRHLQSHVSLLLLPHVLSCKCLALSLHLSTCHLHTVSLENVLDHCFSLLSSSLPSCVVISLFTSILPWR